MEEQLDLQNMSDHDLTTTLVANVKTLKESQDKFHCEMKESFRDLKNNYSDRINKLEDTKTDKEFMDKITADFESRIRIQEKFADNLLGKMSILTVFIASGVAIITNWLKTKL